ERLVRCHPALLRHGACGRRRAERRDGVDAADVFRPARMLGADPSETDDSDRQWPLPLLHRRQILSERVADASLATACGTAFAALLRYNERTMVRGNAPRERGAAYLTVVF